MVKLKYIIGDFLDPVREDPNKWAILAHVVNNKGAFGAGVALQIAKQFPDAKRHYKEWTHSITFKLGAVEFTIVETEHLVIAHLCAQDGLPDEYNPTPLRYGALKDCIVKLGTSAAEMNAEVHMPKIGCGYARGKWPLVVPFLEKWIPDTIPVTVYFKPGDLDKPNYGNWMVRSHIAASTPLSECNDRTKKPRVWDR
jgi:O-acetyl-ADP-ribose deacetylase (regulator of RNase III)